MPVGGTKKYFHFFVGDINKCITFVTMKQNRHIQPIMGTEKNTGVDARTLEAIMFDILMR